MHQFGFIANKAHNKSIPHGMCIYDMERNAGLEPVTFGLGSRRSTN